VAAAQTHRRPPAGGDAAAVGMGGIGKTQLAEFCHRWAYHGLHWLAPTRTWRPASPPAVCHAVSAWPEIQAERVRYPAGHNARGGVPTGAAILGNLPEGHATIRRIAATWRGWRLNCAANGRKHPRRGRSDQMPKERMLRPARSRSANLKISRSRLTSMGMVYPLMGQFRRPMGVQSQRG
jgi:hypothetical protein